MSVTLETFNPSALSRADSLSTSAQPTGRTGPAPYGKNARNGNNSSSLRIDFEPLYTELKSLISHNWSIYQEALSKFVLGMVHRGFCIYFARIELRNTDTLRIGRISSAEFADLTDAFLLATPQVEHAHNSLICAILYNISREKPEHSGPAIWVTATNDKSSAANTSKTNIASDAGEQRLKAEVMGLPARDRRRLKNLNAGGEKADDGALLRRKYEDYYLAGKVRAPENVPPSAGGLNKTNWDLEIRKRYAQPLFSETLEFPDATGIHARMIPICYEESVASGSSMPCAELVSVATETYVKDLLSSVFNRTRINGPKHEIRAVGGVCTNAYLRQREREEQEYREGKAQKGRENGLLPVEWREASSRRPIGIDDLRVAGGVARGLWNGMPLIGSRIAEAAYETELDEWLEERRAAEAASTNNKSEGYAIHGATAERGGGDEMEVGEDNDDYYGWQGAGSTDRAALGSLLEQCLSVRA